MTNIFKTPEKRLLKGRLVQVAEEALRNEGWTVERVAGSGKSSLRRITKDKVQKIVSIRTSQNTTIAFPRTDTDDAWATLNEVDYVVASSVDARENPRFIQVHMIDGDDMRARFDRAYAARKAANHIIPVGRGVWIPLYDKEASSPVYSVGAGAGLAYPPIARVPLTPEEANEAVQEVAQQPEEDAIDAPLTIAEAKRRLALTFGVTEADVKITISS